MLTGMHTEGYVTQDSANDDMEIFIGASEFVDVAAHATLASAAAGEFTLNLAASLTANLFANLTAVLRRTGMYATPTNTQEQFGTAASVPGPTTVANTSDPLGIAGYPPFTAAQLPTLKGAVSGPIPKGMQINSVDVIYEVDSVALTTATIGLTKTKFANAAAPVVTNIIALGANGLPTATNTAGQTTDKNVAVASPAMITDASSSVVANVNFTTPAGSSVKFYGINLHVSFNLN